MLVMSFIGAVFLAAQITTELQANTVAAFDRYFKGVNTEMAARAASTAPFSGRTPGVASHAAGKEVGNGMIHDWSAIEFIPGAKRADAVAILRDIPKHSSIYPEVVEARLERSDDGRLIAFHRIRKKKVFEVTLDLRYQIDHLPGPPSRYATRSIATEIVEVEEPGKPTEKRLPPGHDHGYLWRLNTFWILEEAADGLWMECRSVSLTRDTPFGLGWAIKPIVRDLPKEALEGLMANTKRALAR